LITGAGETALADGSNKWQATQRPPACCTGSGIFVRQTSIAFGQRG